MSRLLTNAEVEEGLKRLRGWRRDGAFIAKDFHFSEFMEGIRFVNEVSKVAEKLDHHPDISIRYADVRLKVQTHSEGGVTARDLRLAEAIDAGTSG